MYIRKFLVLHSKDFTLLGKTLHISIFTSLKQFSGTLSKRANIYKVSGLDILNIYKVSGLDIPNIYKVSGSDIPNIYIVSGLDIPNIYIVSGLDLRNVFFC